MQGVPNKTGMTVQERVQELIEEVLAGTPHFLVDLDVRGARGSQVVDVYVDSDQALGVDDLARISRDLGFLLDAEDVIPDRYSLNVSSPGVDRPLKFPRQYRKHVGRNVRVHYRKAEGDGNTEVAGILKSADDEAVDVEVAERDIRRIPYDDIVWAKIQLPW